MSSSKQQGFVPYVGDAYSEEEMLLRSKRLYAHLSQRRSLRHFSTRSFPRTILEYCIRSASCAPSGAHKQPWSFCVVSDPELKKAIRTAAEKEEYTNYHGRMSERWIKDLEPLGTDWNKPFLEEAPYLIVIFKRVYEPGFTPSDRHNNYYVNESVGLACGFFLLALHEVGLIALTHTPSPMKFLTELLERPENERPFLLIPVGYPSEKATIPQLKRKELNDFTYFYLPKDTSSATQSSTQNT